jgi:hypothetical protein
LVALFYRELLLLLAIFETHNFNFLLYIRLGGIFAFEVEKLHDFWCLAKNCVLVYNHFCSFLENLDIDEFNKILGHCAYGNDKLFLLLVIYLSSK